MEGTYEGYGGRLHRVTEGTEKCQRENRYNFCLCKQSEATSSCIFIFFSLETSVTLLLCYSVYRSSRSSPYLFFFLCFLNCFGLWSAGGGVGIGND